MKTTELEIDFEADSLVKASDEQLRNVAATAQKMLTLTQKIEQAEEWVKKHKELLRTIQEVDLVNAMDACGMSSFTLDSGQQIIVKQICAGSIPKAHEAEALEWLRKNKFDAIIKRKIEVSLGRGMDKLGTKAVDALKKMGLEVKQSETVHSQTLGAWAREIIEGGKITLPLDLLGIYVGRRATVK
jgi:hypothetical protein